MSLIRRKPTKKIRVSEAARLIGCSSKSIKRGAIGNFRLFRLKDSRTSPYYVLAADVERFLEQIEA
jgi:hypothetical protein